MDYDTDGDLDIYQVCHCAPADRDQAFKASAPNRLFRQESPGRFVEVPGAAGLDDPGYGHGCAVGDADNDGDDDVFVTNYGESAYYVNEGGVFRNATKEAGFRGDHWSSAAAFFDYDRDGDLDLWVVNFGLFDDSRRCDSASDPNAPDYCGPHLFEGVPDQLYRNNGDGTFTDVSEEAGIAAPGRGWGVVCADLTGDGWPDVYVANDEEPNQFWVNDGQGGFSDEAMFRGCAVNGAGRVEAGMGIAVGDVNSDERLDLFVTHVASETNTIFALGEGDLYDDITQRAGAGVVDLPYTGWGCALVDLDHDTDLDMVVANGRVAAGPVLPSAKLGAYWNRYAEPNLLFLNDGTGRFEDVSGQTGEFHSRAGLARGMAVGDLDSDGDLDFVTNGIDNQLYVYRNDAPVRSSHWLQLRVLDGPRDAVGAKVRLWTAKHEQLRFVLPSYSYLSSNDARVHFGLGSATNVERVEVTFVPGTVERFAIEGVDREVTLRRGAGKPIELEQVTNEE